MTFLNNKDSKIITAENEIFLSYGDRVSVETKGKSLYKFGRNNAVGTLESDIWLVGGVETLATGNTIGYISSSNASDTQNMKIEGHTLSGSDLTFVVQDKNLSGQTKVAIDTPLYRLTRMYNNGSSNLAGTVYAYEDDTLVAGVPQTTSKIHARTEGSNNQTLKCATSISSVDYWIVTSLSCSVNRQNTRTVDFQLKTKEFGKVFRTKAVISVSSNSGNSFITFDPYIIIKPNSDVKVTAISSGADTGVDASINGFLAIII